MIASLHHVQLAMPAGGEEAARAFYGLLLGITEREKPDELKVRGGCWFEAGDLRIHMGVEQDFRAAQKAHIALVTGDLDGLSDMLFSAGHMPTPTTPLDNHSRFYVNDPFGNRLEFISKTIDLEIRPALPVDRDSILALHKKAFPTDAESRLVTLLEADGDITLSLVALVEGEIVGNIILSPEKVEADDADIVAWAIGPIGVNPELQHKQIGSALMKAAIAQAKEQKIQMIFLLGDPKYYRRFDFSAKTAKPFASPYSGPYFQALLLDDDLTLPTSGTADYAPAFARLG